MKLTGWALGNGRSRRAAAKPPRKGTAMEKKYTVFVKICGIHSGACWQSRSDMVEEWAIVEPYGIQVKTFKTEAEAVEYCKSKYGG